MSISRRNFIKIGGISAALLTGSCLGFEKKVFGQTRKFSGKDISSEVFSDLLSSYRADTFRRLVGSEFSLFSETFAGTAVLTEVRDSPFSDRKKMNGKTTFIPSENFILLFNVPDNTAKQATYNVIHRELGQFDLLLVPSRNQKGEYFLRAVINRL